MFAENLPSRSLTGLTHPEDSQEANTVVSHVSGVQENAGCVPVENSNSFPSSSDLPANPASLQNHLANLKTMMSRQKAEYESKIASLEQRNRALQFEIKDMHSKLGQQQKESGSRLSADTSESENAILPHKVHGMKQLCPVHCTKVTVAVLTTVAHRAD
ncbi:rho GTPase-activating protein 24-like [Rhea pennata]|uniref:rho GTPase-activating protein 24-like n=1 Tax=Rhea pennata TaxID=8795 RepID=UPI002E25CD1F